MDTEEVDIEEKYTALRPIENRVTIKMQRLGFESGRGLRRTFEDGIQEAQVELTEPVVQQRILCVDDSPYNLFVLKELIQAIDRDIVIETALNGQEALTAIEESKLEVMGGQPKCAYGIILLDLHMPVLDGYQVNLLVLLILYRLPRS